ncbi:OmpA family protein [Thalassotalea sp. 1_MG-2023]|uniref:OmpA family protein n=1 Tax=Thalassotalea sp. 1_MG-2023 TaxID=3062680 RepID=UPI0026E243D3|nr:OmpA family protein [Thalassotalea sp. 1_MG-2023]MDO6427534.1 OmpA family protein [Thalassotalea sp. 1_MG-2023]
MRTLSLATLGVTLALTSLTTSYALATEQPDAEELVGKNYLGAHGLHINTDDDRLITDPNFGTTSLDNGAGAGLELGYRITKDFEARLSYSYINLDAKDDRFDVASGTNTALDLLYFPYQKSFYMVAGANFLDVDHSNLSPGVGAGYRHYISNNAAFYLEGQGMYQLDDNHVDFVSKIGFIYYFGDIDSPAAAPAAKPVKPANNQQEQLPADSDKDGVPDAVDKCMNTPLNNKVNSVGCTIFMEREKVMDLSVHFAHDKYEVKPEALPEIERAAKFLKQYPQESITINGHTSAVGDDKYNQELSQKRAQAIVNILTEQFNIDSSRLTAEGHGESELLDSANTAAAHAKNRRIEARIVGTKRVPVQR